MSESDQPPATVVAHLSRSIAGVLGAAQEAFPSPLPSPPRAPRRGGPASGDDKMVPTPSPWRTAAPPIVQLFTPMVPWNWPVPVVGSLPYQQLAMADSVPASTESGVPYEPSSGSFSRNYANFLRLIEADKFPLPSLLDEAIAATVPPVESPTGSIAPAPDGWARAPDGAGINRWRMVYGVSTTPAEWVAQVGANPGDAVELSVPITGEKALTLTAPGGERQSMSLLGDVEHALITASALSQVSVMPGSWFDDSLLRLGRNGPFVGSLPSPGPYAGMLNGRVSGLIVAYNPVLRIVGPDPDHSATGAALSTAAAVEIGGFTFPAPVATPLGAGDDAAGTAADTAAGTVAASPVAYHARAAGAWIIGVTIEVFP